MMNDTDYAIEKAAKKAEGLASENFKAGRVYENPYSKSDVIHYTYESAWKRLVKTEKHVVKIS